MTFGPRDGAVAGNGRDFFDDLTQSFVSSVTGFTTTQTDADDDEYHQPTHIVPVDPKDKISKRTAPPIIEATDLVGREKEFEQLVDAWAELVHKDTDAKDITSSSSSASSKWNKKPVSSAAGKLVLLHGESGTGKSRLIEAFREKVLHANDNKGVFVSGKFDQQWSHRFPFHALVDALSDLCDFLAFRSPDDVEKVAQEIESKMEEEDWTSFLQFVNVPNELSVLIHQKKEGALSHQEQSTFEYSSTEHQSPRVQRACRLFLETIAALHPIVLCLDDIQWTDDECIRLLQSLSSFLISAAPMTFVFSFRDGYNLSETLSLGLDKPSVLDLPLSGFDEFDVVSFLTKSLMMPQKEICDANLGIIVYEKTGGNPFFVVQFLELMKVKGLLVWSAKHRTWECENIGGVALLDVSKGVSSSVSERLSQLDPVSISTLAIAAHLGFELKKKDPGDCTLKSSAKVL